MTEEEAREGGSGKRPSVSVARCETYEQTALHQAVLRTLEPLGGIGKFVSPGERILLKPNMLSPKRPDEAVTTHPEIVRAMIRLVKQAGGTPVVGDSPGGQAAIRTRRAVAERTGIAEACRQEEVELVMFAASSKVEFPEGLYAKAFDLTTVLNEVDGVISLAKLKTHTFTGLTAAVKNLYGLIPGLAKAEYHLRMRDARAFCEMLVDLAECVRPRLTLVDGIVGMDGDGPAAGNPRRLGLLAACDDPHALDAALIRMLDVSPKDAPTVSAAIRRGLIAEGMKGVEIVGDVKEEFRVHGFRMPRPVSPASRSIPARLAGRFAQEVLSRKPVFSAPGCDLCGACIDACPSKALRRGDVIPLVDRDACIRCYCCQEVCPGRAVALKRMLGRSLARALAEAASPTRRMNSQS